MAVSARDMALEGFWPGQVTGYSVAFGGDNNVESSAPTPTPGAEAPVIGMPGGINDAWADRDRDSSDFLREVERIRRREALEHGDVVPLVGVNATSLSVDVRATFLDVLIVERNNRVELTATFDEAPDEVFFVYTRPDSSRPVVNPGLEQPGSRIEQLSETEFLYTIDTTRFPGGLILWHFWGTRDGVPVGSDFGDKDNGRAIQIPNRLAQLL